MVDNLPAPEGPYRSPSKDSRAYREKRKLILEQIAIMFSGYSKDDYPSSDLFVRQLEVVMMKYPPSVILAVTSPETGIQRKLKRRIYFADVVEALEKEMGDFTKRATEQQHKRLRREENIDRSTRPTLEEIAARHADMEWAQRILKRAPAAGPRTPEQRLAAYNELRAASGQPPMTQAEFDAIPDALPGWSSFSPLKSA